MKLPNFLVIGAPRSGTTSLYFYLKQHPEIFLPVRKELHYFSYDLIAKNISGPGDKDTLQILCADKPSYLEHYKGVKNEIAIGEISPSYLYYAQVSQRIHQELGQIKIIAILRNPIEKAFSQYMHLVRLNLEKLSFHEALFVEEERKKQKWGDIWRYAESSLYSSKIQTYIDVFGEENIHIVLMEEFVLDPQKILGSIFSFLDVKNSFQVDTNRIYNKSGIPRSKSVARFFAHQNLLKKILKKIVPEHIRVPLRMAILNANLTPKQEVMDTRSRQFLVEYFKSDIFKLEEILNYSTEWL